MEEKQEQQSNSLRGRIRNWLIARGLEHQMHTAHHGLHCVYFLLVATHGPYYWPAALLFVLVLVAMVLHLDLE